MSLELLCSANTTLKFSDSLVTGLITILPTSVLSTKTKAEGLTLYHSISFTVTGAAKGTCTAGTGAGIINGTTTLCKEFTLPFVKESGETTILITGTDSGSPCSFSTTIQIDNTGQTKVKGE